MRMTGTIDNPILNSPYEQPDRHYLIGPQGPTGEIKDGQRVRVDEGDGGLVITPANEPVREAVE